MKKSVMTILKLALISSLMLCVYRAWGYDQQNVIQNQAYKDGVGLHLDTATAITGTWTCSEHSNLCTEDAGGDAGDALNELTAGDIVLIDTYSYEILSSPAHTATTFYRSAEKHTPAYPSHSADTVYIINTGATATLQVIDDGAGTATALELSTASVGSTGNLEVDGIAALNGYGVSTGTALVLDSSRTSPTGYGGIWYYIDDISYDGYVTGVTSVVENGTANDGMRGGYFGVIQEGAGGTPYLRGFDGGAYHAGTGNVAKAQGLEAEVQNYGNGTIVLTQIVRAELANYSGNTATTVYGVTVDGWNCDGTETNTYAYYFDDATRCGATLAYGIYGVGGDNFLQAGAATVIPLTLKGASSQSANLQDWRDSAGALLASMDKDGDFDCTTLTVDSYTRYIDFEPNAAVLGPTAPSLTDAGTFRTLGFDADAERVDLSFEVPDDWVEDTDMTLKIYWTNTSGDAIQDTETVKWDIGYRVIDFVNGEVYDNGTAATGTVTYTQSGGAGTDKATHVSTITLADDDANQPLEYDYVVGISFDRDVTGDTYSGAALVVRWEIGLTSNSLATH